MGLWLCRLIQLFDSFSNDPARILMVGLDSAGKTTILYKIKLNAVVSHIPTIGFDVETLNPEKGVTFTVWDVGGQERIRPAWPHCCKGCRGVLYVLDSADRDRFLESRDELHKVMEAKDMRAVPVVVLANEQDLPGAASESEVAERLELTKLRNRKWHVQATCATSGDSMYEGMLEMCRLVKDFKWRFRLRSVSASKN